MSQVTRNDFEALRRDLQRDTEKRTEQLEKMIELSAREISSDVDEKLEATSASLAEEAKAGAAGAAKEAFKRRAIWSHAVSLVVGIGAALGFVEIQFQTRVENAVLSTYAAAIGFEGDTEPSVEGLGFSERVSRYAASWFSNPEDRLLRYTGGMTLRQSVGEWQEETHAALSDEVATWQESAELNYAEASTGWQSTANTTLTYLDERNAHYMTRWDGYVDNTEDRMAELLLEAASRRAAVTNLLALSFSSAEGMRPSHLQAIEHNVVALSETFDTVVERGELYEASIALERLLQHFATIGNRAAAFDMLDELMRSAAFAHELYTGRLAQLEPELCEAGARHVIALAAFDEDVVDTVGVLTDAVQYRDEPAAECLFLEFFTDGMRGVELRTVVVERLGALPDGGDKAFTGLLDYITSLDGAGARFLSVQPEATEVIENLRAVLHLLSPQRALSFGALSSDLSPAEFSVLAPTSLEPGTPNAQEVIPVAE